MLCYLNKMDLLSTEEDFLKKRPDQECKDVLKYLES